MPDTVQKKPELEVLLVYIMGLHSTYTKLVLSFQLSLQAHYKVLIYSNQYK